MDTARHPSVRSHFDALRAMGRDDRARALRELALVDPAAHEEVASLLRYHDSSAGILDRALPSLAEHLASDPAGSSSIMMQPMPTQVGSYRVVCELGRGGMGVVYEAQQESPRRHVALKLIRPEYATPGLVRRFELEAEALGLMHHPGIAQIYESGRAQVDGQERLYIAMELVVGRTLVEHVRAKGLGTQQVLELVAKVCDAVDHAHRRGVIHRDLKPGNIIVDDAGVPRVLDFGVARLASQDDPSRSMHTRTGQVIGTLDFMSPEQLSGDMARVDVRSDVYALGAVLFEALCGRTPFELGGKDFFSAIDAVRNADAPRVRRMRPHLPADVESIVAKALEKDPARRYQSASALGDDIRRAMQGEPVIAHPQTAWYQVRKFAARNRALVGLASLAVAALGIGLVVSTWQARVARNALARESVANQQLQERLEEVKRLSESESQQRTLAQRQAATAQGVTTYLVQFLESAAPEYSGGRELTMREALGRAAGGVERELGGQPEVLERVTAIIGQTFSALGDHVRSEEFFRRTMDLQRTAHPSDPAVYAESAAHVARALDSQDKVPQAEALLAQVLAELDSAKQAEDVSPQRRADLELARAHVLAVLGMSRRTLEKYDLAIAHQREALAIFESRLGADDRLTLDTAGMLAMSLRMVEGGPEVEAEAERLARRNAEGCVRVHGEDHPITIAARANLAVLLSESGRDEDARVINEAILASARRILPSDHPDLIDISVNLAVNYADLELMDKAIAIYEEMLPKALAMHGPEHERCRMMRNNFSVALEAAGELDRAQEQLEALLEVQLRTDARSTRTIVTLSNASRVARKLKHVQRALELARHADGLARESLPEGHPLRGITGLSLGSALADAGETDAADAALREAYPILAKAFGESSVRTCAAAKAIARLAEQRGDEAQRAQWAALDTCSAQQSK